MNREDGMFLITVALIKLLKKNGLTSIVVEESDGDVLVDHFLYSKLNAKEQKITIGFDEIGSELSKEIATEIIADEIAQKLVKKLKQKEKEETDASKHH